MKLRELDATFLKINSDGSHEYVDSLSQAQGLMFLCPKCFAANGGKAGTHMVICWFVGVDPKVDPKPGRWTPAGTSLDDLSFIPGSGRSNSVLLHGGCNWHGFVKNGDAA